MTTADLSSVPAPAHSVWPRFCGECGYAWQPTWARCQMCGAATLRTPVGSPAVHHPTGRLEPNRSSRPIASALALFFSLLAICLLGSVIGASVLNAANSAFVLEAAISVVVIGSVVQWQREKDISLLRVPQPEWFAGAVGLSLITFTVATLVSTVIRGVARVPAGNGSEIFLHNHYGWGVIVLAVAVQPAIFEELAFRGVILGKLRQTLTISESVVVSAMMFMALHLNVVRFPHTLALGLAAGMLRVRSRSILPCMVLHFSHNLMCVLVDWAGRCRFDR